MEHEMPQSLLVFAVSLTQETPHYGTFGGVAHPLEEFFFNFVFLSVYMHILKFNYEKKLILKKNSGYP